jgi:large subunit ribosomal protein L17
MLNNLALSLITHEQITTTLPKAKDLRPIVEKLITKGKQGDLSARRYLLGRLHVKSVVDKLIGEFSTRYGSRQGGYVRIIKAGFRYGDMAPLAVIELVDRNVQAKGAGDKSL